MWGHCRGNILSACIWVIQLKSEFFFSSIITLDSGSEKCVHFVFCHVRINGVKSRNQSIWIGWFWYKRKFPLNVFEKKLNFTSNRVRYWHSIELKTHVFTSSSYSFEVIFDEWKLKPFRIPCDSVCVCAFVSSFCGFQCLDTQRT